MRTKSGKAVFPIGIGTWMVAGDFLLDPSQKYKGAVPVRGKEAAEIAAIRYSVEKGQNHIDCAELYGGFYTDEVVGDALSIFPREDLFIADKLWKTSVGEGQVRPTVMKMLDKLQTSYLDLLYIHAPWPEVDWREAIPQIDALIDEGVVRYFGVSNFSIADMEEATKIARHSIAANQMNYNVLYQDEVTDEFRRYCLQHDIQIVAYQPIKRREVYENDHIVKMVATYGATPAQIALAWLLAKGAWPIPKSTNTEHIDQNIAAAALVLSEQDINILDTQLA